MNEQQRELERFLQNAEKKEKSAARRALLFTLIPILIGAAWMVFAWQQVNKAAKEESKIALRVDQLNNEKAQLENDLMKAKEDLDYVEKQKKAVQETIDNLTISEKDKEMLVDQVDLISAPTDEDRFGIITGADKKLDEAKYEVGFYKRKLGIETVQLYKRKNFYRTVIGPFNESAQAQELLGQVLDLKRHNAYVVKINSWCSNPSNSTNGVIECGN